MVSATVLLRLRLRSMALLCIGEKCGGRGCVLEIGKATPTIRQEDYIILTPLSINMLQQIQSGKSLQSIEQYYLKLLGLPFD